MSTHKRDRLAQRAGAMLHLTRPANVITSSADAVAGWAIAGAEGFDQLGLVMLASAALYAGGVVLNDVFDAPRDAEDRPERPIPRGLVLRASAGLFGAAMLVAGVITAALVGPIPAALAGAIALCALGYDAGLKRVAAIGALTMGACRGLNLALGISVSVAALSQWWWLGLAPTVFIAAITSLAKGEVVGGREAARRARRSAVVVVLALAASVGWLAAVAAVSSEVDLLWAAPLLIGFALLAGPAVVRAKRRPEPVNIGRAVKLSILSLVVWDAALAAGFAGPIYGLAVLAMLAAAWVLSRLFAVT